MPEEQSPADGRPRGPDGKGPAPWGRIAATYALATVCGAAGQAAGVPLAFILGPLLGCGLAAAFGLPVAVAPHMRELGQVAVGLSAGMRFTGPVLMAALQLLPAMFLSSLYMILVTSLASLLLRPLARVDATTAFFATAAGGMADMAVVAAERGGDAGAVSIVHVLRVASVVSVVPFLVTAFGTPGASAVAQGGSDTAEGWLSVGVALGLAYLAARLLRPTFIPNPWLLGPLLVGAFLGASGLLIVAVPDLLIILAQILIGTWLGCRFRRELLARLPRVAFAGLLVSLLMIGAAGAGAWILSLATGLPGTTAFLALAPAAVTEMVLTARAMNADVAMVTAFHVMRIAVVGSSVLLVFAIYNRLAGGRDGSRV